MAATLRFQALVDRSGRPEVYTPWSDPHKDPAFQKARKENRVLTIHQNLRGAKDYGAVGFEEGRGFQFFLFPKSLRWAEGKRVIGIHYEDIAETKSRAAAPAKPKEKAKPAITRQAARAAAVSPTPPTESKESRGGKEPDSAKSKKEAESANENRIVAQPVKRDPLTDQLIKVLVDLENQHVTKARSALRKMIQERERS